MPLKKILPDDATQTTPSSYHTHILSEKSRKTFPQFLVSMVIFEIFSFLWRLIFDVISMGTTTPTTPTPYSYTDTPPESKTTPLLLFLHLPLLTLTVVLATLFLHFKPTRFSTTLAPPLLATLLWTSLILLPSLTITTEQAHPLSNIPPLLLQSVLIWLTLPVNMATAGTVAIVIAGAHTLVVGYRGMMGGQSGWGRQLLATLTSLLATNAIGFLAFQVNDLKQRLAFKDTRESLQVKEVMEGAAKEQKRLLYSVLPRELAETMAQDMDASSSSNDGGAFKKIYMNRHEPVSILFADIVGFTAMSAAIGSAAKLVEILNDLFSAFDELSEKHEQTRIKILGDCYYCICGAPEANSQHAFLSVHMGLAVVEAIKIFQKRTNSAVDMRVGIHTGAVLAGVLGQRQWQFDVYSEDVTLANKMESSGQPGRVHISNKTLEHLEAGQFEVEPGDGDAQEEKLRMKGIKTFFIKKVLVGYNPEEKKKEKIIKKVANHDDHQNQNHQNHPPSTTTTEANKQFHPVTLRFHDAEKETAYTLHCHTPQQLLPLSIASFTILLTTPLVIAFHPATLLVQSLIFVSVSTLAFLFVTGRLDDEDLLLRRPVMNILITCVGFVLVGVVEPLVALLPCIFSTSPCLATNYVLATFLPLALFAFAVVSSVPSWLKVGVASGGVLLVLLCFLGVGGGASGVDVPNLLNLLLVLVVVSGVSWKLDHSSRTLFLQKYQISQLKEQAVKLRERNEALMCNIMPQHVAQHFLQNPNTTELYSHTYDQVGILFASMPNFSDFYTEDAVNNQGLECLRFLNEVISDYDVITDLPQFRQKIIKIKTIGSTYMAASGLNPEFLQDQSSESSIRDQWRHLSLLVQFVFEMLSTLDRINKESYNQFVLRIGLNHGPVTAGVIGATKPAYDTWGNTVNVASRMESTGSAGKIQVTEDCYKILRIYGYEFELRGMVAVKGKGNLKTYFLIGKGEGRELNDDELEQLDKKNGSSDSNLPEVY